MTGPPRRTRVESICDGALNLAPHARDTFVRDACGSDDRLRAEVEGLLAQASHADALDQPLAALAARVLRPSGSGPASTLPSGIRFGVYEIVQLIDVGGMGQVYRARDTDLGREVALKVLLPEVATDGERLARFEHEARVLASLNHPNIAAIHGVVRGEGRLAIVMELVAGKTLAARVASGPLATAEASGIVRQLAVALEAAHEKGIVHRDLKPSNVIVSPAGLVTVLDFGLAKMAEVAAGPGGATGLDAPETRTGTVMGTAAYMSPEQASGQRVDKRTDVWALGCVWFELLAGGRAFRGNSSAEILAAVLREEPDWSRLPANLPPRLLGLLTKCLAKPWHERLADVSTVRFVLDELDADRAAHPAAHRPDAGMPATGSVFNRRAWWVPGLAVALAALLGLAAWTWGTWSPASTPDPASTTVRSTIVLPPGVRVTFPAALALSPDGTLVVYPTNAEGRVQLVKRRLADAQGMPIDGTEDAEHPFFSPDGQWLGFRVADQIKKVRIDGGRPVTVAELASVAGASWGADGFIVAGRYQESGLWRVKDSGGSPEQLTKVTPEDGSNDHRWPQVLPNGRGVLFSVGTGPEESARIVILDALTGKRKEVLAGSASARYVPTGHLAYGRNGELLAVPFDLERMEITGPAVRLAEGVNEDTDGTPEYAFSDQGDLVYRPGWSGGPRDALTFVELNGAVHDTAFPQSPMFAPRFAPDGRRLALTVGTAKNNVWVYDIGRATATRVTAGRYQAPIWTNDGRLVMSKWSPGGMDLVRRTADIEGPEETLVTADRTQFASGFAADGRLVFERVSSPTRWDILAVAPGSTDVIPVVSTPALDELPRVSADGRWLAYTSDDSGRKEAYVRGLGPLTGRQRVSTNGAAEIAWAPDGRTLYYTTSTDPAMWAVTVATAPALTLGAPVRLFATQDFQDGFDVSPDGTRFAMIRRGPGPPRDRLELVLRALGPATAPR